MIRWCSYCQQFLGERAPFDDFGLTHGICLTCKKKNLDLSEDELNSIQKLKDLQVKLWNAGKTGNADHAPSLIAEAVSAKVRHIDILMGLLAPLLKKIGEDWAQGKITVAEEHRFTSFSEVVLENITAIINKQLAPNPVQKEIDVLLVNAEGNHHNLGIRTIALFCLSYSLNTKVITNSVSQEELLDEVMRLKPKVLGISMSLPEQTLWVAKAVDALLTNSTLPHLQILLGGSAVNRGLVPPVEGATFIRDVSSLGNLVGLKKSS
jgi:methanogenic corrinoid protein MtbC1